MARRGMGGVLDDDSYSLVPGVAVEDAPDELGVLRNLVPGVGGAVDADEPAAAQHEVEERLPNLRPEWGAARREEQDCSNAGKGVDGETLEVVARIELTDVERAGPPSEIHDGPLGEREAVWRLPSNHVVRSEERRVGKECRSRWSP